MCVCCGKYYRDLPYEGMGMYSGFRLCKSCGNAQGIPLEDEENSTLDTKEKSGYNKED
jgi:hypothetical protein